MSDGEKTEAILTGVELAEQMLPFLLAQLPNPQDTVSKILARMQQANQSQDPTATERTQLKNDAAEAGSDETK